MLTSGFPGARCLNIFLAHFVIPSTSKLKQLSDFWKDLNRPFFLLAPMEDVTDTVFRELVMSVSSGNHLRVLFTEFTSVDGICHPKGRDAVIHRLMVNASERKILGELNARLVVQIWGNDPEKFFEASRFIKDNYRFDGIDINMGCPAEKIVKQGSCSALIGQHTRVSEIIQAVREGSGMPVSVKTRTGLREHTTESWITHLLQCKLSAITLHARTQRAMSLKPAEWNQVALAVKLRNSITPEVKLIGNGDVADMYHGLKLIESTGADGVMIGRGIFSDPWFFNNASLERNRHEKLQLLRKHINLFRDTWPVGRNFNILKRFFKIYVHGFDGAASLRAQLMETTRPETAIQIIEENL